MKALYLAATLGALAATGHAAGTHEHSHDDAVAVGKPGMAENVTRTVDVRMYETDDGEMLFDPKSFDVKAGETIRFAISNDGELEHEFVLDTIANNIEHRDLMQRFPEMEHDDPNSIRLAPGESGDIIWTFSNAGEFQYACLIPGHMESGMAGPVDVADG